MEEEGAWDFTQKTDLQKVVLFVTMFSTLLSLIVNCCNLKFGGKCWYLHLFEQSASALSLIQFKIKRLLVLKQNMDSEICNPPCFLWIGQIQSNYCKIITVKWNLIHFTECGFPGLLVRRIDLMHRWHAAVTQLSLGCHSN